MHRPVAEPRDHSARNFNLADKKCQGYHPNRCLQVQTGTGMAFTLQKESLPEIVM